MAEDHPIDAGARARAALRSLAGLPPTQIVRTTLEQAGLPLPAVGAEMPPAALDGVRQAVVDQAEALAPPDPYPTPGVPDPDPPGWVGTAASTTTYPRVPAAAPACQGAQTDVDAAGSVAARQASEIAAAEGRALIGACAPPPRVSGFPIPHSADAVFRRPGDEPPPADAEPVVEARAVFQCTISLALSDPRMPEVRRLVDQIQAVLASLGGPRPSGRPPLVRRGTITTPSGEQFSFGTLAECARQLRASYPGVSTAYREACRAAGVDPDDHDGVEFRYKGDKVLVCVR
jgi:hypothetical protein